MAEKSVDPGDSFSKVRSTTTSEEFAVKKMYEPFNSALKAKRVFRELKLLQLINHENIIRFIEIYTPDSDLRHFKDM